ncbi:MAG: pyridoxamine 5'-phosphate oxidase family protein [Halobacteriota archaeon]
MRFEECVKFATEHIHCSFATVDGDQPHVRMLSLWFANESGFYFPATNTGNVYRQLSVNPKVELCFYAPPETPTAQRPRIGKMMRATGTVELIDDPAMKERLFNDRPFIRPFAEKTVIFRVHQGEAWFWTFADSGRESIIERITF